MRCPKCGKDVELQKKQVGVDESGKPIFNEYAVCKDCKKQWNLDKQRDKKAAANNASNHIKPKENVPAKAKPVTAKEGNVKSEGATPASPAVSRPAERKAPVKKEALNKEPVKKEPQEGTPVKKAAPKKRPAAGLPGTPTKAPIAKASVPDEKTAPSGTLAAASNEDSRVPVKKAAPAGGRPTSANRPAHSGKPGNPARKPAEANSSASPAPKAASSGQKPVQKKRPSSGDAVRRKPVGAAEEQRYANIPPEKIRAKRERVVKDSYEDMLATDPNRKSVTKKRPAPTEESAPKRKTSSSSSAPVKRRPAPEPAEKAPLEKEEPNSKFRVLRIVFGIISILAFGFFAYKGFMAGLDNISSGKNTTIGTTYIVLALCMLVAGLLLLIMQKRQTIFSFILPMIFYIACAAFAFFKRADDKFLLYGAIAGAVLAVIFLVLTIASRGGDEDYGYEDEYDDPFDEDHDNY